MHTRTLWQTAATTDPKNKPYILSSADGAVLLRLKVRQSCLTVDDTTHVLYVVSLLVTVGFAIRVDRRFVHKYMLQRVQAVAPDSGPVTFPLAMHVQYPVKYKGQDTFDFSYQLDIETVAP